MERATPACPLGAAPGVLELLQAQQRQLAALSSRLALLSDEHGALCECLAASGAVPAERLHAGLHRRRFLAVLRQHPSSHESLETFVRVRELALLLVERVGLAAAASLSAASRGLRRGMSAAAPEAAGLFPLRLHAVGGEAGGAVMASVECFDVMTSTWHPSVPMSSPRSGCAAVALGGRLYVAGGCSAEGEDLSSVDRLDLQRLLWEPQPPMSVGRDELAAVAADGRIFAIGGSHLVWPVRHVVDTAECFGVSQGGSWQPLPRLSTERCAAAAACHAGFVYVLGGCDEDGTALDSAERLNILATAWEPLPAMRRPRCNFAAAAAAGRLFVVGGYDDRMRDLDTIESLDPSTGRWDLVTALAVPRWGVRAVGRGGFVFIVGGHARDGEVSTVDRLDPVTGRWLALPPLRGARRSFGLTASCG